MSSAWDFRGIFEENVHVIGYFSPKAQMKKESKKIIVFTLSLN